MRRRRRDACVLVVLAAMKPIAAKRMTAKGEAIYRAFIDSFYNASSSCGGRAVMLDVGANDGGFTSSFMKGRERWRSKCNFARRLGVYIVEPAIRFRALLERQVAVLNNHAKVHATFLPKAAWLSNTNLVFSISSKNSQTSHARGEGTAASNGDVIVPAFDLADFILALQPVDKLLMLKLDVEGSEYLVLPRLLGTGALCRVSHLIVEWHLERLTMEKRLAGLALKLSLRSQLASGCRTPPKVLFEEFRPLNYGVMVPGLLDEAVLHTDPGVTVASLPKHKLNYTLSLSKRHRKHEATFIDGSRL